MNWEAIGAIGEAFGAIEIHATFAYFETYSASRRSVDASNDAAVEASITKLRV
jgi:hypothetical protein